MKCLKVAICLGALLGAGTTVLPQAYSLPANKLDESVKATETPILGEIRFDGLRRIAPAAVAAQIRFHAGDRFDPAVLDGDIRSLARLGWFESIRVEAVPSTAPLAQLTDNFDHLTLTFHLRELPFLSKVEYEGSLLLSQKQIEKMLDERKLAPGFGKPADPVALYRIGLAIRAGLNELGHPEASVRIVNEKTENASVTVRFEINDGPLLRVRKVNFDGHPQVSAKLLRAQMHSIAPWKPFAPWRGNNVYTQEKFEEDRQRILTFYQNHGFPEARIGCARVVQSSELSRRWLPWPHESIQAGLNISMPVEAGAFYRFESITATGALQEAARKHRPLPIGLADKNNAGAFSQQEIDKLRRFWAARIQSRNSAVDSHPSSSVDVTRTFNSENHTARVVFDLNDSPSYTVKRIDFLGLHKFSDRYVRRKFLLREGGPVDDRALEVSFLRLAKTGYFKPIHKEDIRVQLDEATHTANISIRLEEIGRQRASLVGGTAQFGSTLGIAYTVFDLLNREELLSAQLEGGPETLQVMLGLAKEGIFGTRASLAFSVFNNVIRPRFASNARGPFFYSRSEGINIPWTYPLNGADSLGVNYTLSRTTTKYSLGSPADLPGLTIGDTRSNISSRSLGIGWTRDTGDERVVFSSSTSGGWLGGGENMLRSSAGYSHIFRDPLFTPAGTWAFRTTISGEGSYSGDMPFYARFFSGDELARGLRPGELGPYAATTSTAPRGATIYSASPAGANLISAATAEYRFPLAGGTEAVGFFDLGSGSLLPNWLGSTKPLLLSTTNGVLHGSTGIELRWTIPGVQVPVRAYYALNVLRLNRFIFFAENSSFHAHNRFSAFGWGFGTLF